MIGNQELNMNEQDGMNALGGIIRMIELLDREQECGLGMPRPYELAGWNTRPPLLMQTGL